MRGLLIGRARAQPAQHAAQRVDLTAERFRVAAPDRLPESRQVLAGLAHEELSDLAEQPRIAPDLLEQLRSVGRDRPPIGGPCRRLGLHRDPLDRIEQRRRLNRFDEIAVHSRAEAALAVFGHRMRGERDDGHASSEALLGPADRAGGLDAVHPGHLHIHQDEVEAPLA